MTDGYYPALDGGLLWIRSLDDCCMISSFVRIRLVSDSTQLDDLLDLIQGMLPVDQVQSVTNIEVIDATQNWMRDSTVKT